MCKWLCKWECWLHPPSDRRYLQSSVQKLVANWRNLARQESKAGYSKQKHNLWISVVSAKKSSQAFDPKSRVVFLSQGFARIFPLCSYQKTVPSGELSSSMGWRGCSLGSGRSATVREAGLLLKCLCWCLELPIPVPACIGHVHEAATRLSRGTLLPVLSPQSLTWAAFNGWDFTPVPHGLRLLSIALALRKHRREWLNFPYNWLQEVEILT